MRPPTLRGDSAAVVRCASRVGAAQALGDVGPAMVGGQHHDIIEPAAIEPGEEMPERVVERVELQAHLEPLGAVAMADIVGCRQADRQHVRRTVAAELALVDEAAGKGEGLSVESGPVGVITCAGAVGQLTGTDGAAARQFRRAVAGRAAHRDRRAAEHRPRSGRRRPD